MTPTGVSRYKAGRLGRVYVKRYCLSEAQQIRYLANGWVWNQMELMWEYEVNYNNIEEISVEQC